MSRKSIKVLKLSKQPHILEPFQKFIKYVLNTDSYRHPFAGVGDRGINSLKHAVTDKIQELKWRRES